MEKEKEKLTKRDKIAYGIVFVLCVIVFILTTMWGCKEVTAEAAVAYLDENSTDKYCYWFEEYDYYFVLESSESQGKKLIFSDSPFVATYNGPDANGYYSVNMWTWNEGANVKIYHEAFQGFDVYTQTLVSNKDPLIVLRYKEGQTYNTNCDISDGFFEVTPNIAEKAFLECMIYAHNQGVVFSQYPNYDFCYSKVNTKFYMYLHTYSDGYRNQYMRIDYNFVTGDMAGSKSPSRYKVDSTIVERDSYGALYANYFYDAYSDTINTPHPNFEGYLAMLGQGATKPTPTPTPTPVPTVTPTPTVTQTPQETLTPTPSPSEPRYNVSAPQLRNPTVTIRNVLASNMSDNSVFDGSIFNGLNTEYEYVPYDEDKMTDVSLSEWTVKFDVYEPWFHGEDLEAKCKFYVWLPSKDYIEELYTEHYIPADPDNGMSLNNHDFGKLSSDIVSFQRSLGEDENSVLYTLEKTIYPAGGRKRYDFMDFYDIIETQYGKEDSEGEWKDFSIANYYGYDEDSNFWLNIYRPIVMSFLSVSRMDSVVYCAVGDAKYYGSYVVFDFFSESEIGVDTIVDKDYINTDNMNQIIENERLESIKNNTSNSTLEGSVGGFDGVVRTFGGLVSGLRACVGVFADLSALIGAIFSFLPYEVQSVAGGFFLVIIVCAIIWAVKGK